MIYGRHVERERDAITKHFNSEIKFLMIDSSSSTMSIATIFLIQHEIMPFIYCAVGVNLTTSSEDFPKCTNDGTKRDVEFYRYLSLE